MLLTNSGPIDSIVSPSKPAGKPALLAKFIGCCPAEVPPDWPNAAACAASPIGSEFGSGGTNGTSVPVMPEAWPAKPYIVDVSWDHIWA